MGNFLKNEEKWGQLLCIIKLCDMVGNAEQSPHRWIGISE